MDVVDEHCAHLLRLNRRPGTIYQRLRTLRRLEEAITPTPILTATIDQLRAHTNRGLGDEAHYAEVSRISGFFQWALRESLIEMDPSVRLERPQRAQGLPRPMPHEQVSRVLREAPEPLRTWFLLAVRAGLRACEIAPVRSQDLHDTLLFIPEQKGGGMGAVPLSPGTMAEISATYIVTPGWWFPHGHDPSRHVTAAQVSKRANCWLRESGIPHTLHSLRHAYATNVYRLSGHDLLLTARLLRHRNLNTTRRYAELADDRASTVVAMLDDVA